MFKFVIYLNTINSYYEPKVEWSEYTMGQLVINTQTNIKSHIRVNATTSIYLGIYTAIKYVLVYIPSIICYHKLSTISK